MKTKLFMLLFCLLSADLFAEQYFPQGSKWDYANYVRTTCMDPECAYSVYHSRVYYVGDTTINNVVYSNLKYYSISDPNFENITFLQDFFIRYEDNKLYGFSSSDAPFLEYDNDNSQDYLLADFNLEVGDSMFLKYQNRYAHVIKTDSVYMKDGTALKRITFDYCQPIVERIISEENMMFLFICNNMITDQPYHPDYAVTMCYEQLVGEDEVIAYSNINKPDIFYSAYQNTIRNSYCGESYYPLWGGVWRALKMSDDGSIKGADIYNAYMSDTLLINGIKYMNLYRDDKLYAAIRCNENKSKWYVSPDFEHEYLMYDFSVKQGDHVDVLLDIETLEGKLTECVVASVEEINGRRHIQLMATDGNGSYLSDKKETWIEGIGSLAGIGQSNMLRTDNMLDSLLCFTTHRTYKQEYYTTINGVNCDNLGNGISMTEETNSLILIEENMLKIESDSEILDITIFDTQGKQILQSQHSSVDISSLSSGLYLVVIQTEKGIWTKKFVK